MPQQQLILRPAKPVFHKKPGSKENAPKNNVVERAVRMIDIGCNSTYELRKSCCDHEKTWDLAIENETQAMKNLWSNISNTDFLQLLVTRTESPKLVGGSSTARPFMKNLREKVSDDEMQLIYNKLLEKFASFCNSGCVVAASDPHSLGGDILAHHHRGRVVTSKQDSNIEFKACSIFFFKRDKNNKKGQDGFYSFVHTHRDDDPTSSNDDICFFSMGYNVDATVQSCDKIPMAVVVRPENRTIVFRQKKEAQKADILSFEENPAIVNMALYKSSKTSMTFPTVSEFISLDFTKHGKLASLSCIKLADGSVELMLSRKPSLDSYIKFAKHLHDEKQKNTDNGSVLNHHNKSASRVPPEK